MNKYDIVIIGTGPAGISAAITATIRNKQILLVGPSLLSNKISQGHTIENYPGLPSITGSDLKKNFIKHLDTLNIKIHDKQVSAIYSMGKYFSIQIGQDLIESTSVILATGVVQGKTITGEEELVGRGVSYCATCDASLYRNKDVIVIGYNKKEEQEVHFLSEIVSSVKYFPLYKEVGNFPQNVEVIKQLPKKIEHDSNNNKNIVVDSNGEQYSADGIFVLRDVISPQQLVPGLKMDGAHVVTNRDMSTNIAGCFACGDITGLPYQYIKSAGEGNVAALSAVSYIDKLKISN